jgi:formylglycine-generating enzyme required for sulfatase activity
MVAHDMVGNLDEWVDDEEGTFRGGFYARASTKGCEAQVTSHSPDYFDYSTGARCCQNPLTKEATEAN